MGKIGDLIVRLQLKHEDYKKGLKQAEADTKGFAGTLGKIKGVGLAVWGAIGTAVLKVASDMVKSTNTMQDKWEIFTTKAKAGWQTFIRTLTNGDWSNFISNFKQEMASAVHLQEILQADTEIMNSIRIQKAQMADQLAELEVAMRDQTKSYKQRADAAKRYLGMVDPIYKKEIERAEALKAAQYEAFVVPAWGAGSGYNKANQAIWDKMLIDYGDLTQREEFGGRSFAEAISAILGNEGLSLTAREGDEWIKLYRSMGAWAAERYGLGNQDAAMEWLMAFFKQYEERRNDEDVKALVDAVVGLAEAQSARNQETKKVQSLLNSAVAQQQKQTSSEGEMQIERMTEALEELTSIQAPALQMNLPDIIPDDWLERNREKIDAALAEAERLQNITDEINSRFNEAVVSSLSGATQALVECIAGVEGADASQVLAALLQPFASTMTSLGEMLLAEGLAIEAFKESLKSLNGAVAIAAGLGLIALGAALSAGIRSLASKGSGSATTTSSYSGGSSAADMQNIQTEMTIYVKGTLKGSDIVLSGQKTVNNWAR